MLKHSRRWFLAGGLVIVAAGMAAAVGLPVLPAARRRMIQRIIYYYAPGIEFEGDGAVCDICRTGDPLAQEIGFAAA